MKINILNVGFYFISTCLEMHKLECIFMLGEKILNLPQHVGKREISLFPILSRSVLAVYKADSGNDSHVWLSGIQNRAFCTKQDPSTKHLFQPSGISTELPSIFGSLFVHVPRPTWETITIPEPNVLFSELCTSVTDLYRISSFQFGQPMTPSTISPSTTRAKPTWKFWVLPSENRK